MSEKNPAGGKVPNRVGKYVLGRELGAGSSGRVFLSHDPYFDRDVAIKLYLLEDGLSESRRRARRQPFFNEAKLAGRLRHPNILPILDAGEEGSIGYVAIEYLPGAESLKSWIQPDRLLPVATVVGIVFKLARAIEYAHRMDVIHRDIKPSNVLRSPDGEVYLIDFGIAVHAGGLQEETGDKPTLAGSPSYMAPELIVGGEANPQTDIYSLGALLYELLVGRRPYGGKTLSDLLHQILYASPLPLGKLKSEIPLALDDIVSHALAKQPEKRFKTCFEFAAALVGVSQNLETVSQELRERERFNLLRRMSFFSDFTYPEIYEILKTGHWATHAQGSRIVSEGDVDERFSLIVTGRARVEQGGKTLGRLQAGDCFGEIGFVTPAKRSVTVVTEEPAEVFSVNATLMEQASVTTQLHFTRVFLKNLITRLARPRVSSQIT
ncbi:serine/threonine-protein kinase [mine drainage metagenome]|uniref:Serine/threonine-protein kinase n=3 Tax=mine drainage metagenome TaxID=410659 RepID=T1A6R0_9ZZZZ